MDYSSKQNAWSKQVHSLLTLPPEGSLQTSAHKVNLCANTAQKWSVLNAIPATRIPTGFHLLAQGCSPRATLGIAPENTLNPNGVASDPSHYASAPLYPGPSSGRIPESRRVLRVVQQHVEQHGGGNGRHHRESGGGIRRHSSPSAIGRARATFQRDHWPTSSMPRAGRFRRGFREPVRGPSQVARTTRAAEAIGCLSLQPQSWIQCVLIGANDNLHSPRMSEVMLTRIFGRGAAGGLRNRARLSGRRAISVFLKAGLW